MTFLEEVQYHPEVFDKYYTPDLIPTPGSNANTHHNPNGERLLGKRKNSPKLIHETLLTHGIVSDKEQALIAQAAALQDSRQVRPGMEPVMAVNYTSVAVLAQQ